MTNYAEFSYRDAPLSSDFGLNFARSYFSAEIIDAMPRYVRGPKRGLPKGSVEWQRCTRGGWVRRGQGEGYVCNAVGKIVEVRLRGPGIYCTRTGMHAGRVVATAYERLPMVADAAD